MIRDYRCRRCHHLLFKGSLELLLTKQHDPTATYIVPKCDKCGLINHFSYDPANHVQKDDPQTSDVSKRLA